MFKKNNIQGVFSKVCFIVVSLLICSQSFAQIDTTGMVRTESGIYYKLSSIEAGKDYPRKGDHLIVDIVKFDEEGIILFDTKALEHMKGVEIVLDEPQYNGDITEIFFKMQKAVTASLFILMDSVDREFLSEEDKGKYYGYEITLRDFKSDKVYKQEQLKHGKHQLKKDHRALKRKIRSTAYVVKLKVDKGLFLTWTKDQNTETINLNDTVKVHYVGSLVNDKRFDSSRQRAEAFEFVFNSKNVIRGWTKLLPYVSLGDRVNLYIASQYAYGRTGAGRDIGPDEPLIFDVEVLMLNGQKPQ